MYLIFHFGNRNDLNFDSPKLSSCGGWCALDKDIRVELLMKRALPAHFVPTVAQSSSIARMGEHACRFDIYDGEIYVVARILTKSFIDD